MVDHLALREIRIIDRGKWRGVWRVQVRGIDPRLRVRKGFLD